MTGSVQMFILWLVLLLAVVVILRVLLIRLTRSYRLKRSLHAVLFRVSLPRARVDPEQQQHAAVREQIAVMEQLYAAFARLSARGAIERLLIGAEHVTFEVAIPAVGEEIAFYIAVPGHIGDEIEKAIHSVYATAHVERITDYNIFHPYSLAAGAILSLKRHPGLPIKTYQTLESDPLQGVTTALSKLSQEGEGAAVQILIKPAAVGLRHQMLRIAREMYKNGHSFEQAQRDVSWIGHFSEVFFPKRRPYEQQRDPVTGEHRQNYGQMRETPTITPIVQETVTAIEQKASKPLFSVNVRLVAAATSKVEAERTLDELGSAFAQFDAPNLNGFRIKKRRGKMLKRLAFRYAFRTFDKRTLMVLSTEELTSLLHFPNVPHGTPNVVFLRAKPAEPPPNLPQEGILIGINDYRGVMTPIRLGPEDRRRHLYTIGQTGTGKTSLLQELIRQDLEAGNGVGVIDPHGDLAEQVLAMVPPSRADDVVYFNPGDTEMPIGLNMLEWTTEEQKDFAVQEMVRIFEKLFPPEVIGPMFEHNMRNAMLTLMADKDQPGTIVEIPRIFTDEPFMKSYLAKLTDPVVRAFWEKEMAKTSDFHRSEMLGYLISKVGRFVENSMMRNIIGQARSGFDLRDIMDSGKIFIANLSKGRVGEINSSLLGLVLVGKMQMAALARADAPEESRRDFYLYIDEFQNFTTDSISTILSEARKYRLNLTIAHQFIAQLPDMIREAVFGNVGSIVSFRVGPNDAEFLERQFAPIFDQQDLINVDNYNAYARIMVNGVAERPFNIVMNPPQAGRPDIGAKLKEYSRLKYGHPRVEVEREILERSKLGSGAVPPPMNPGERNA